MSRIDQALRVSEAVAPLEAIQPDLPASAGLEPLEQYRRERGPSGPDASQIEPTVQQSARRERIDPVSTVATSVPAAAAEVDLQARLVTGTVGSVPLEQYRRVAAVLHEEQVLSQLKTVMVTSTLPREGKTLTTVNLALTLADSYGRRVLLIDADLRWPSLHAVLNIRNGSGLSEALRTGQAELPVVHISEHLAVLTAGHPGHSPLADLTSERMGEVITDCAGRFDWVLIDTPPVGLLPDAQVLARLVGAVIYVIGAGSTPAEAVEAAIAELGSESIIGTVLNRIEERRIVEAGYYGQYGTPVYAR